MSPRLLYLAQGSRCFLCNEPMEPRQGNRKKRPQGWTRDHLHGRARPEIVLAHAACNEDRGNQPATWRQLLAYGALLGRIEELHASCE